MRRRVSAGGPSTIYGIEYQILGSLLELSNVAIINSENRENEEGLNSVLLRLEPARGGDLIIEQPGGSRVLQYKARSNQGKWSWRDVLQKVLPDLFRAVDPNDSCRYEFVTDGGRGDWKGIEDWIKSIGLLEIDKSGSVISLFSDAKDFRFKGSLSGNAPETVLSERELFETIAREVDPKADQDEAHFGKVLNLLSGLSFVWDMSADSWRDTIRRRLRPLGVMEDEVADKVAILCGALRSSAITGESIDPVAFLHEHGLDSTPLTNWGPLLNKGKESLPRFLRLLHYDAGTDVRANKLLDNEKQWWDSGAPFAVLSGSSGQGKTWRQSAVANVLSEEVLVVAIRSQGNAFADKQQIERIVSQDIRGKTPVNSLEDIARDVSEFASKHKHRWLCVCIDNVTSAQLASEIWTAFGGIEGVRVLVNAQEEIAVSLADSLGENAVVISVPDFSENELRDYVVDGDFQKFHDIDPSIREVIGRPLLASLYRSISQEGVRPENEYGLYHSYFERWVCSVLRREAPTLLPRLRKAALSVWRGEPYPWRIEQLESFGFTDERIARLISMGWLVRGESETYRVWHDRLLEWAVAEALARQVETGNAKVDQIAERWRDVLSSDIRTGKALTGFWAMDLVWHLARGGNSSSDALDAILKSGEQDYHLLSALYDELLPTIGAAIAPASVRRLTDPDSSKRHDLVRRISDILATIQSKETDRALSQQINSSDWQLRRAATRYFAKSPSELVVEPLWHRYRLLVSDKEQGYEIRRDEKPDNLFERMDVYKALEACAILDPNWIENRIAESEEDSKYVSTLASFLRLLPDGQARWEGLRETIVEKLEGIGEIERAKAAGQFMTESEIGWLRSNLRNDNNSIRWASMDALVQISPDEAIRALGELDAPDLTVTTNYILMPLLAQKPVETTQKLLELMGKADEGLWLYARLVGMGPIGLDGEILDDLLERASQYVANADFNLLSRAFDAFESIRSPELLKHFWDQGGSKLDTGIADLLLDPKRVNGGRSELLLNSAIKLLRRIAGPGLTRVVNAWLGDSDRRQVLKAIGLARHRPDDETRAHLRRLALEDLPDNDRYGVRFAATTTLALIGGWREIVDCYLAWHKGNDRNLVNARLGLGRLEHEAMAPALAEWKSGNPSPGAIMAVGFGHYEEYTDQIGAILASGEADSDTANACLWALVMMPELTLGAIESLAGQLSREDSWVALMALLHHRTKDSIAPLIPYLNKAYTDPPPSSIGMDKIQDQTATMRAALHFEDLREEAKDMCLALVRAGIERNFYAEDLVHSLARDVRWHPEFEFLMLESKTQSYLKEFAFQRDGAFQRVGRKLSAIRGLSVFSPLEAYEATLRILRNPKAHDRQFSPYELLEYDRNRAKIDLFDHLGVETRSAFRTTIGRALAEYGEAESFAELLNDKDTDVAKNAAFVLGFGMYKEQVMASLRRLIDSADRAVSRQCVESVRRLERAKLANDLVAAYLAETNQSRRWVLLDTILEVGDPGDEHRGIPNWAEPIEQEAEPALSEFISEEFRRKKESNRKALETSDIHSQN